MISTQAVGVDGGFVLAFATIVGTRVVVGVCRVVVVVVVEALLLVLTRAYDVDVVVVVLEGGSEGVDVWRVVLRKRWG